MESRLRRAASVNDEDFGFIPGRSTMGRILAFRMTVEEYRDGQKQ